METLISKDINEAKQGEVYAPFANDPNTYNKKFYIESYGCAMNLSDSEIVASILNDKGFGATRIIEEADLIFINTCSIREKAEQTVRNKLQNYAVFKKTNPSLLVGVLGCMAERLKAKLLEEEKNPQALKLLLTTYKEHKALEKDLLKLMGTVIFKTNT